MIKGYSDKNITVVNIDSILLEVAKVSFYHF